MPRVSLAVALTAVLPTLLVPGAAADPSPDCLVLRQAAGPYSRLASHFSSLRKVAEQPGQHPEVKQDLAEQARAMGETLRDLSGRLTDQDLKNLYWRDAESFDEYADVVLGNVGSSDPSAVKAAHERNVQAVNAANKAYHTLCK